MGAWMPRMASTFNIVDHYMAHFMCANRLYDIPSLHIHFDTVPGFHAQGLGRIAAVDGDFEQSRAVQDRQDRAFGNLVVGCADPVQREVGQRDPESLLPGRLQEEAIVDIRYYIAIVVYMQYVTHDPAFANRWAGYGPAVEIVDFGAESGDWRAKCEMSSHGGEDVPPVKRIADSWEHVPGLSHGNDTEIGLPGVHVGEDAVIRTDEAIPGRFHDQGPPLAAHAGIDDGHVHRAVRKVGIGGAQDESAFFDPLGRDPVGQIDDPGLRAYAQDDPLHGAHECVAVAEVGKERDHGHGLTFFSSGDAASAHDPDSSASLDSPGCPVSPNAPASLD